MRINHLNYFYVVAREGSFSRAAALLHVAQPAVSKMIKQLEEDLGFLLFDRQHRSIRLTRSGAEVYRHCDLLFDEFKKIADLASRKTDLGGGPVYLGASEAIASHLMPEVIESLGQKTPDILPTITTGPASDLCRKVYDGQLEFALLLHSPKLDAGLEIRTSYLIPHRLVVARQKKRCSKTLASFIGSREVDDTSNKRFPTLRRIQRDIEGATIRISTNSMTAHKDLVLRGLGVAVLPVFVIKTDLAKGKLVCLYPKEKFTWPLVIIARRGHVFSRNAELFLERTDHVVKGFCEKN